MLSNWWAKCHQSHDIVNLPRKRTAITLSRSQLQWLVHQTQGGGCWFLWQTLTISPLWNSAKLLHSYGDPNSIYMVCQKELILHENSGRVSKWRKLCRNKQKKRSPKEYNLRTNQTCETSDCGDPSGSKQQHHKQRQTLILVPCIWVLTKLIQIDPYDSNFTNTPKRI